MTNIIHAAERKVGRKVVMKFTTNEPEYDQNIYRLKSTGLSRSRTIFPDWMFLPISHTTYISMKLNSAVASTRYMRVSEKVMPFTTSVGDEAYMAFHRKYTTIR